MDADLNYYWFRHGDAAFFVWDTRRYRSTNSMEDGPDKTMLGPLQKAVYLNWLATVRLASALGAFSVLMSVCTGQ